MAEIASLRHKVKQSIAKAGKFLEKTGRPRIIMSESPYIEAGCELDSPFVSALILWALKQTGATNSNPAVRQNINYLIQHMEFPGVWRFSPSLPHLPPDLDDTVCALVSLKEFGISKIDYTEISDFLLKFRSPAGLFFTWLVDDEFLATFGKKNDIDIVVNLNALL